MPKWVEVGDKYVQRDGSGNETWPLDLPASARSVVMFLSCDKDVKGGIGVYDGTTAIGAVTFSGCGGLNWSSGSHDVGPTEWPTSIQVAVRQGVRWKATIYYSDDPIPVG